jgi:hypothetical protein
MMADDIYNCIDIFDPMYLSLSNNLLGTRYLFYVARNWKIMLCVVLESEDTDVGFQDIGDCGRPAFIMYRL